MAAKTVTAKLQGGPMDGHTVQFPDGSPIEFLVSDPQSATRKFIQARYERTDASGSLPLYRFVETLPASDMRYTDRPQLN